MTKFFLIFFADRRPLDICMCIYRFRHTEAHSFSYIYTRPLYIFTYMYYMHMYIEFVLDVLCVRENLQMKLCIYIVISIKYKSLLCHQYQYQEHAIRQII